MKKLLTQIAVSFLSQRPMMYNWKMQHIGSHIRQTRQRIRETERGELMKYFCDRLNASRLRDGLPAMTMGHMGKTLEKIPTKDLYYLKRVCDDAGNFSKRFWWELDPDKHKDEK